ASMAILPSDLEGNNAAAMPWTSRRSLRRVMSLSSVKLRSPDWEHDGSWSVFFRGNQLLHQFRIFVETVQRVTSRRQPVSRGRRAVTKRSANSFSLNRVSLCGVPQQLGVGQDHSAETNHVRPALAHSCLRNMREVVLQIAVACAHENQVRKLLLQSSRRVQVTCRTYQRVFGRKISVGRGIESRSLKVGIVVGTSGGDVYQV